MGDWKNFLKRFRKRPEEALDTLFMPQPLEDDPLGEASQLEQDVIAGNDTQGRLPQYAPISVTISGYITPEQVAIAKERAKSTWSGKEKPEPISEDIKRKHETARILAEKTDDKKLRDWGTW